MADKIYIDTKNQKSTIVANDIKTLKNVSWQEIEEVSGRTDVKTLSLNRQEQAKKRAYEEEHGMEPADRDWVLNKFFKTLSSWNSLYIKQCSDYDMLEYEAYLNYKEAYTNLFRIQSFLEKLEPEESGLYDVSKYNTFDKDNLPLYLYTWSGDWKAYYEACDELDKILITRKQKEYIIKMITLYQLNTSNTEPPAWQDTDEGWGERPESKKKSQALWGRTTYYYANDTFTRNRPYLIQGITGSDEDEPIESNMKISLSSDTITWTARGLKLEKEIRLNIEYYDMSKVSIVVSKGTGIEINDTQEENVKKIVTPTFAEEMSSSIIIRAFVLQEAQTIAEATCTLYKQIIGKAEAVYLGCFDSVPLAYSHDNVEDHLVLGDWWLCKSKEGTSSEKDFMFSVSYELIDLNTSTLRSAWQIVDDKEKLRQTIPDNIAIGGYAMSNGEFENIIVALSSMLYGSTTIGKDSNDSLIVNSKNIINAETIFNSLSTFKGNLAIDGISYFNNNVLSRNILPQSSNTYSLGNSNNLWNSLFVKTLKVNNKDLISYLTQYSKDNSIILSYNMFFYNEGEEVYKESYVWTMLVFKISNRVFAIAFGNGGSPREIIPNYDTIYFDLPLFNISYEEFSQTNAEAYSSTKSYYYKFITVNNINILFNGKTINNGKWSYNSVSSSHYCQTSSSITETIDTSQILIFGSLEAYSI